MELKNTLTEIVKYPASFEYYRDGNLYYSVIVDFQVLYTFPIDVTDTNDLGNASLLRLYPKAITLMRYIRKAIDNNTITYEVLAGDNQGEKSENFKPFNETN